MSERRVVVRFQIDWLILLAIVFVAFKATGLIDWSWWWVLAPVWIPLALAVGTLGTFYVFWTVHRRRLLRTQKGWQK